MTKVTIVGLDLAKSVFQVHGADKEGRPVVRKKLRRGQVLAFFAGLSPCLIPPSGMPDSRWGFPSGPISDSMW